MKYSEFKAEVEKMGLFLDAREHGIEIVDKYGREYAYSSKENEMIVDTAYENFPKLPQEQRAGLFDLLYEIAKTPLTEREEEKRYRLRYDVPPLLRTGHAEPSYFVISRIDGSPDTSYSPMEYEGFQKIFTESEIAQMDITGFQKVEVPE